MEWISVKDELPQDKQWVLVFENDIYLCKFIETSKKEGYFTDNECDFFSDVTHWMPLPEEPTV